MQAQVHFKNDLTADMILSTIYHPLSTCELIVLSAIFFKSADIYILRAFTGQSDNVLIISCIPS